MRYFKFSILTGIGLFALAMFFLSQSISDFLNPATEQAASDLDMEIELAEPEEFPALNLDFPAGVKPKPATPSEETPLVVNTGNQVDASLLPENKPSNINLVSPSEKSADLNILLLSQTTKAQRTTLLEELMRIDAELVQQVVLKPAAPPTTQPEKLSSRNVKTVQQISLTESFPPDNVAAGYAVIEADPQSAPQSDLVQKERIVHIIAAYRGLAFKTTGIPTQNAVLNQAVTVIPFVTNTMLPATVIGENLVQLDFRSELPVPSETRGQPVLKLSQLGEFQPAEIIKLTGTGLVVGLNGTGEQNFSHEAIQALKTSMTSMNIDLKQIKTPLRAGNLANVSLIAYIPNQGVKKGQAIECYLAASSPEINLTGGYLLPTTLQQGNSPKASAVVMGMLQTNRTQNKSQALIDSGAQLLTSITPRLISGSGIPHLKFFLNENASLPKTSQYITHAINQALDAQPNFNSKAILQSSSMIMISLPQSNPKLARQLATNLQTLSIPIHSSLAQAANVLEAKPEMMVQPSTKTIQFRGNVLLQPTQLQRDDLILEIGTSKESPAPRLSDLLALMHYLKVPKQRQIEFLRELQQQGKIQGDFHEL